MPGVPVSEATALQMAEQLAGLLLSHLSVDICSEL